MTYRPHAPAYGTEPLYQPLTVELRGPDALKRLAARRDVGNRLAAHRYLEAMASSAWPRRFLRDFGDDWPPAPDPAGVLESIAIYEADLNRARIPDDGPWEVGTVTIGPLVDADWLRKRVEEPGPGRSWSYEATGPAVQSPDMMLVTYDEPTYEGTADLREMAAAARAARLGPFVMSAEQRADLKGKRVLLSVKPEDH